MDNITQKGIDRFWKHVDRSGGPQSCWNWMLSKNRNGYGQVGWKGKNCRTNRVAYEITFGEIQDGLFVLHKCDNRACCNPSHLFLGTNQDNIKDMYAKGRRAISFGEDHPRHKLTDQQVREIRKLYDAGGQSYRKLAKLFGCSYSQIDQIVNRESRLHS